MGSTALLLTACGGDSKESTATAPASPSSAAPSAGPSAAPSAAPTGSSASGEYVDRDGFAVTYPTGWTVRPDLAGLQVVGSPAEQRDPAFADNVGVVLEDTAQPGLTVAQDVQASLTNAPKQIPKFTLIDSDDKAGTLEYTGEVGRPLHFLARVVVQDGKAFTATYTATTATFDAGRADAEKVLASLQPR